MERHKVVFYSPGTMVSETTTKVIDSWDIEKVKEMAKDIKERHNSLPYGFSFLTEEIKDGEWEPKETARSNIYYLGGKIETLEEIKSRNDPQDRILISNMECNGFSKVIVNTNSWKITLPFNEEDIIL